MPIYEFYCEDCNTIFNFFSKTVNTTKRPNCPMCKKRKLSRQMSAFSFTGRAKEDGDMDAHHQGDEEGRQGHVQLRRRGDEALGVEPPHRAQHGLRRRGRLHDGLGHHGQLEQPGHPVGGDEDPSPVEGSPVEMARAGADEGGEEHHRRSGRGLGSLGLVGLAGHEEGVGDSPVPGQLQEKEGKEEEEDRTLAESCNRRGIWCSGRKIFYRGNEYST